MTTERSVHPICPRCGGSVMAPIAWPALTIGGDVYLIMCPNCGAVMGTVRKTPEEMAQQAGAERD